MRKRILSALTVLFFGLVAFVIPASAAEPVTYHFSRVSNDLVTCSFSRRSSAVGSVVTTSNSFSHLHAGDPFLVYLNEDYGKSSSYYDISLNFAADSSFPLRVIKQGMQTHISFRADFGSNQQRLPGNVSSPYFALLFSTSSGREYTFSLSDYGGFYKPDDYSWHCEWDFILPAEIQGVSSVSLYMSGSNNVALSSAPWFFNVIQIGAQTMTIQQTSNNQDIIDEDYGYSKPSTPETDEGLKEGNNLLDTINSRLGDFSSDIDVTTSEFISNVQRIKPFIDGVFNVLPLPITIAIAGVVFFLVIRKVVGR